MVDYLPPLRAEDAVTRAGVCLHKLAKSLEIHDRVLLRELAENGQQLVLRQFPALPSQSPLDARYVDEILIFVVEVLENAPQPFPIKERLAVN